MPKTTRREIPPEAQAQRLAALRRARYGDLLALPIVLWCAAGRWLHAGGWVWKRATRVATDDDPPRVSRLARLRYRFAQLRRCAARVCADEREIHRLPTVGGAWMPQGTPLEGLTPGQPQQHALAGALERSTGMLPHGLGLRNTHALFRDLRTPLEARSPADRSTRLAVVVATDTLHPAKAGEDCLAAHPRVTLPFWPTACPRANPIARA